MTALVALVAYLLGGSPTADWFANRRGVDLRTAGSKNPGANNAMRIGGRRLGATILTVEVAKGAACVGLGAALAGETGMAVAGIAAAAGNVFNPYRRFKGGQGLGISAGILIAAIPAAALGGIAVISGLAIVFRKSAPATLAALGVIVAVGAWLPAQPWGIADNRWASVLCVGLAAVIAPKQIQKITPTVRRPPPAPS